MLIIREDLRATALKAVAFFVEGMMKRLEKGRKRRCPECNTSSKNWVFLEAVPVTPEVLMDYLLVKYRCSKCNKTFLAEEGKKTRYVKSAERCYSCKSKRIEKISREGADIELYQCRQCNAYMGITKNDALINKSFFIVDSRLIKKR